MNTNIENTTTNNVEELKETNNLEQTTVETPSYITFDDFTKLDMQVGTIIDSEKVEKSDKLLKNIVEINGENKVIVSGIANYYNPQDIIGQQVVVVTNLAPIKLRGVMSHGMILCAYNKTQDKLCFVSPTQIMPTGSEVN